MRSMLPLFYNQPLKEIDDEVHTVQSLYTNLNNWNDNGR